MFARESLIKILAQQEKDSQLLQCARDICASVLNRVNGPIVVQKLIELLPEDQQSLYVAQYQDVSQGKAEYVLLPVNKLFFEPLKKSEHGVNVAFVVFVDPDEETSVFLAASCVLFQPSEEGRSEKITQWNMSGEELLHHIGASGVQRLAEMIPRN